MGGCWSGFARFLSDDGQAFREPNAVRLGDCPARLSYVQLDLAVPVIQKSRMTRFEAFAAEFAVWDGLTPRIFMLFDKAPIAAQDIFVSVDKRHVRICTNAGANTADWTTHPPIVKGVKK